MCTNLAKSKPLAYSSLSGEAAAAAHGRAIQAKTRSFESINAFLSECGVGAIEQDADKIAQAAMDEWWCGIRDSLFASVARQDAAEVTAVQPVCDALLVTAFDTLRAVTEKATDKLWLYTERKLNEDWPALRHLSDADRHYLARKNKQTAATVAPAVPRSRRR